MAITTSPIPKAVIGPYIGQNIANVKVIYTHS